MTDYFGTKPYVAPEIEDGQSYYPYPSEIYSLGIILKELINVPEAAEVVE